MEKLKINHINEYIQYKFIILYAYLYVVRGML